jgi:FAD/FMN-containing dehydrogenase
VAPPLAGRPPVTVIVEAGAWSDAAAGVLVDEVAAALEACPEVTASAVATDEPTRARLWEGRERHAEAVATVGIPHKLDVAVPLGRLAAFERAARSRVAAVAPGATTVVWGHVGDGNLHVNVVGPAPDDEAVDRAVLALAAEHGGTIAAEHGVGVAKVDQLGLTRSREEVAAMARLKRALDPQGTLNPGVVLPWPLGQFSEV